MRRSTKSHFLAFLVGMLFPATTVLAGYTGVITGRVDLQGGPLPGASVTVRGENLQGERTVFTNDSGVYRLAELPPGIYELQVEISSVGTQRVEGLRVRINQTTRQDVTLELRFEEETTAVAANPLVDVDKVTTGVLVEQELAQRLANSDQYQQVFQLAGGVNGGGNVRVHGGSQTDNLYLFDGIDTTDPVTSTFGANMNADAIAETEVQTGGFQAEYGRVQGGIVNALTHSGGNRFEGTLRLKYVDESWTDEDRRTQTVQGDLSYWEPTVSLGGPILKDKLWFFMSYKRTDLEGEGAVLKDEYIDNPRDPEATKLYDTSQLWEYPFAKLSFQPTVSHKFVASWNSDSAEIPTANALATDDAQQVQEQGGPFYGLEWTWIMDAQTFLTVRGGLQNVRLKVIPADEDADTPSITLNEEGTTYGNYGRWNDEDRRRYSLHTALSRFMDTRRGTHDLKVGAEYQLLERKTLDFPPGHAQYTYFEDDRHWEAQTSNFDQEVAYDGDYLALYVQDNWEILDGLTISPGLRYEYAEFSTDLGGDAGRFDDMIAPRLGVSWAPDPSVPGKLYGSVGRYYNALDLQIPATLGTQQTTSFWRYDPDPDSGRPYYDPDPGDPSYHPPAPSPDDPNGWEFESDTGVLPDVLDPNIKPEYTDEVVLGYERELLKDLSVGLVFTRRWTRDIIEDVGIFVHPETGETYDAFELVDREDLWHLWPNGPDYYYLTNPEGAERNYYGLELITNGRTRRFSWLASYTYSVAKGTVIGAQPGGAGFTHFSGYYDTPSLTRNLYGNLPWDCTHYVKLNGSYSLPWGSSIGITVISKDGYAYSKLTNPSDGMYNQRWSLEEEGRGTYRNNWWTFADVSLQHDLDFDRFGVLTLILDIQNITDNQSSISNADSYNPNRPWLFGEENGYLPPRTYTAQLKYSF